MTDRLTDRQNRMQVYAYEKGRIIHTYADKGYNSAT